MDKYKICKWIIKNIDNCKTLSHWENCINLIQNFNKMFLDNDLKSILTEHHNFKLKQMTYSH